MILALLVALTGLMPDLSIDVLGAVVLALTAAVVVFKAHAARTTLQQQPRRPRWEATTYLLIDVAQVAPLLIGGVSLIVGSGGGLYWIGTALLAIFSLSMATTWVLLIEVRR